MVREGSGAWSQGVRRFGLWEPTWDSAYGGSWGAWLLAGALRSADLPPAVGSVAGALLLVGTLMPMLAVYVLFPRLKTLGVAQNDGRPDADPRSGFWRHCFGMHPTLRGWAVFGTLLVWRWVMFFVAFGFPTLGAALKNAVVSLPVLLLGVALKKLAGAVACSRYLNAGCRYGHPGTGRGSAPPDAPWCPLRPQGLYGGCGTCRSLQSPARFRARCRSGGSFW